MNNESKKKESILRNNAVQTIIASLLCIVIGLLIGYLVLLIINPAGAAGAITAIIKNYFYYPSQKAMMKYMGTTLVKASALLMCSLSVLFAYKVGLFNIGAAGQYVVGAGASLYFALKGGILSSAPCCARRGWSKSRSIHICCGRTGCGHRCRGSFSGSLQSESRPPRVHSYSSSSFNTAMNASDGTATVPNVRMRFLPSFCFSRSFFFRVISPP